MQEQVDNRISVSLADEGFIRRIGDAFNAVELVVFQARGIRRFPAGNNPF